MVSVPPSRTRSVFTVVGMDCPSCAKALATKLQKVRGVSSAGVNYISDQAYVEYDSGLVTPGEIVASIAEAGYQGFEARGRAR